jgi:hypothetical protein
MPIVPYIVSAKRSDDTPLKAGFCKNLDVRLRYEFQPLAQPDLPVMKDGVQLGQYSQLINRGIGYKYQADWLAVCRCQLP